MNCISCANWSLKSSSLARHGFAPCSLGKSYDALPPDHSCARHKPVEQAAADRRVLYLARQDEKHKQGVTV